MKLKTIYDKSVIDKYLEDNNGFDFTNAHLYASVENLTKILGKPTEDWRRESWVDVQISWSVLDEDTGKMFDIWAGVCGADRILDEQNVHWHITTDHSVQSDDAAEELVEYIDSQIKEKQLVFVPDPVIGKRRLKGGVNGDFCVNVDSGMFVTNDVFVDRDLYCELNGDSKLYKRFYSKLSPELQEEFDVLIGETMAYLEETRFNMPDHNAHIDNALRKILTRYNYKVKQIDREKRKAEKTK